MGKDTIKFEAVLIEVDGHEFALIPYGGTLQPGGKAKKLNVIVPVPTKGRTMIGQIDVKEANISMETLIEYGYVRPVDETIPTKVQMVVPGRHDLRTIRSVQDVYRQNPTYQHLHPNVRGLGDKVFVVQQGGGEQIPVEVLNYFGDYVD